MGPGIKYHGLLSRPQLLSLIGKFGIALAPYHPQPDSFSYYASPGRVYEYLACGLPTIITPVPLIAKQIAAKKAGILIKYDTNKLIKAIDKLIKSDQFYWQARKNAIQMVKNLSWDKILSKAFKDMS